jgi:hypothetical protein
MTLKTPGGINAAKPAHQLTKFEYLSGLALQGLLANPKIVNSLENLEQGEASSMIAFNAAGLAADLMLRLSGADHEFIFFGEEDEASASGPTEENKN